MAATYFVLFLFFAAARGQTACYYCDDILRPSDCQVIVECGPHQICYSDEYITPDNRTSYSVGCRDKMVCEVEGSLTIHQREDRCSKCCSGDYCNRWLCDPGERDREQQLSPGLQCFNCKDIADPSKCGLLTTCTADTQCYTEYVLTDMFRLRYNMGCRMDAGCSLLAGRRSLASKSKREEHLCQQCCQTEFCNKELCPDSTTTPGITTSTPEMITVTEIPVTTTATPITTTATPITTTAIPVMTTAVPVKTTAVPVMTSATPAPAMTTAAPVETQEITAVPTTTAAPQITTAAGFSCYSCDHMDDPQSCTYAETCQQHENTCYLERKIGHEQKYKMGCIEGHKCHNGTVSHNGHQYEMCCSEDRCNKKFESNPVLTCYTCDSHEIDSCDHHVACLADESCYARSGLHGHGQKREYDYGCIPRQQCDPSAFREPPKHDYTESCITCCHDSYCNSGPCQETQTTSAPTPMSSTAKPGSSTEGTTHSPIHGTRRCLSCLDAEDPESCTTVATCPMGEECYYFRKQVEGRIVHDFGCSAIQKCSELQPFVSDCSTTTDPSHQCISCCVDDMCTSEFSSKGPRECMSCKELEKPGMCDTKTVCPDTEVCYYFRQFAEGKIVHDFGCSVRDKCTQLGPFLHDCNDETDPSKQCIACCNYGLCNKKFTTP